MKINKILLILGMFSLLLILSAIFSSLHNIDLSHNINYLEQPKDSNFVMIGLVDNNGIIEQPIDEMYNRSYLTLWFLIPIALFMAFTIGIFINDN